MNINQRKIMFPTVYNKASLVKIQKVSSLGVRAKIHHVEFWPNDDKCIPVFTNRSPFTAKVPLRDLFGSHNKTWSLFGTF